MTVEQFQRKFAKHRLVLVPNVGPRGKYSLEVRDQAAGAIGCCNTIDEAISMAEDWLTNPDTHEYEQSANFVDCCAVCGECESAHAFEAK